MNNWSTPSAHDGRRPGSDDTSTQERNLKREAENFLADAEHAIWGGNLTSTPKHEGGIDLEGAVELWKTPTAMDHWMTNNPRTDGGQEQLTNQAALWQTPQVDSFRSRGGDRKDEMGLDQQARRQFPSPAGRDYRSPNAKSFQERGGQMKGEQLPNFIEHSFLPDQPTESDGQKSSPKGRTSRRRLNTKFVTWLQGLPQGWTSPAPISSADLET